MKFLIIQSDGQHKGQDHLTSNYYLRECYAIKHAINKNGHIADIWGLRHHDYNTIPEFNNYDIIFCIENYELDWLPDFSKIKPLKLYWVIDLHCRPIDIYKHITKDFDIVLHSTKSLIYKLNNSNQRHIWFPNGIDDRYFNYADTNKSIDLLFVGSMNKRRNHIINDMINFGLRYEFATGQDMIDLIRKAKIHFNKNISCDINYRTFETVGLGTCLVTDYDDDLISIGFKDGYNCLLYKTLDEAKYKIKSALSDGSWKNIGINGSKLVDNNSYVKRIQDLLVTINRLA